MAQQGTTLEDNIVSSSALFPFSHGLSGAEEEDMADMLVEGDVLMHRAAAVITVTGRDAFEYEVLRMPEEEGDEASTQSGGEDEEASTSTGNKVRCVGGISVLIDLRRYAETCSPFVAFLSIGWLLQVYRFVFIRRRFCPRACGAPPRRRPTAPHRARCMARSCTQPNSWRRGSAMPATAGRVPTWNTNCGA